MNAMKHHILTPAIKQAVPERYLKNVESMEEDENGLTVRFRKPGKGKPGQRISVKDDYFRVVVEREANKAEMFLYGYIGQDFWFDETMNEESITDLAFVRSLRELEKEYKRIDIRINSPGGSVMHGDPIIAAIRNSPAEIHTYNDGTAASMAADIWLAGDVRHMASNSKLMIHSTWTIEMGTAKDMRAAADRLDKFDAAAVSTFAAVTGWDEEKVRNRFYDYEDHWLTAKEAQDIGLIDAIDNYEAQPAAEEKSYRALVEHFTAQKEETKEVSPAAQVITIDPQKDLAEQLKPYYGENVAVSFDGEEEGAGEEKEAKTIPISKAKTILAGNTTRGRK